jgi:hypothetical protein
MLIICNGMPRSASTWSFNVVIGLLREMLGPSHIYGAYNESIVDFLKQVPSDATHAVVKAHSLDQVGRILVQTGAAKVVYTWREPTDAIVSFMGMFEVDFEHAFAVTEDSLRLLQFHRCYCNTSILEYDEVIADPLGVVTRIAAFLGDHFSTSNIASVAAANSIDQMREKVAQLGQNKESGNLVRLERTSYDPKTLLNLNHIRNGRSGYGKDNLTEMQLMLVKQLKRQYGLID